ncbi:hypothetical protein D9758_004733 [Tetrapyrgos nigripes]|uniref:Alcohol acetyltransferase n=1 Tax=Tetrapyrgos nigripes TaxID=182062 RepID=A0A8H5H0V3_9AGAR|nr:hypothetical protein D9758_004733 [Tetrapyrgos nigripes]
MAELRSPGLLESYHLVSHGLGMDSCVLSAAKYVHPDPDIFSLCQQLLFPALHSIIPQHPILCVRASDARVSPIHFIRMDTIDLSKIVRYLDQSSQHLEEVIESELTKPFDTTRDVPLWRLTVLNDNTIIFAFHHGIGDGMSGLAFHRTLLRTLRAQNQKPDSFIQKVFVPKDITLVGASDQLTDVSSSWSQVIRAVLDLFIPSPWTSAAKSWTGNDVPVQIPPLQAHARIIQVAARDAQRLLDVCRAHEATITSALHSLMISSLSNILQNSSYLPLVTNKSTLFSGIPVSLRFQTGVSKDAICNHLSMIFVTSPIQPQFSWSEASALATTLRTKSRTCKSEVGLLRFLFGNYAGFLKGNLGKKRQTTLELSNIGRFELDDHEDDNEKRGPSWEIQDLVFAHCNVTMGAAIKLNVASAPSGNMAICVTWGDCTVDSQLVDMFIERLKHQISDLVEGSVPEY